MKHLDDDFSIDENGNITGSFTMRLNGRDYEVPIRTSFEKIMQEERNGEDPNSREKQDIDDDEIVIPIKGFHEDFVLGSVGLDGDIGSRMFALSIAANAGGYNNVVIKKVDYNAIIKHRLEVKEKTITE